MDKTIGEVSALAGVSIRTLRHYDELGLVVPGMRSEAGYRLYTRSDIERLQHVLFYRELGLPLSTIRSVMDEPGFERASVLLEQRALLGEKVCRLETMIAAIDRTLAAQERGYEMTDEEMLEVFGDFDPARHEDEVRDRWGDTDAYRESARRTARYTKAHWQRVKDEGEAILNRMVELFDGGVAPTEVEAMDVAEEARLQIDREFYPCSREMHVNLGEMYITDPRFTAYYDTHRDGLASWFRDAIVANSRRS